MQVVSRIRQASCNQKIGKGTEDEGVLGCETGRFVGRQGPKTSSNLLLPFSLQLGSLQVLTAACPNIGLYSRRLDSQTR
jgi:hypothetical protein